MKAYLLARIAECDQVFQEIDANNSESDKQKLANEARRDAYQDVLDYFLNIQVSIYNNKKHGRPGIRSESWRQVFEHMADISPRSANNDELMAFIMRQGLTISRQALRAQLSTYAKRGFLQRTDLGVYEITPQGAAALGIILTETKGTVSRSRLHRPVNTLSEQSRRQRLRQPAPQ